MCVAVVYRAISVNFALGIYWLMISSAIQLYVMSVRYCLCITYVCAHINLAFCLCLRFIDDLVNIAV